MKLSDRERALIARSVSALRRHGWPVGKALTLVAERLPAEEAGELVALAAALGRGETPAAGADPLVQLLVQGEAAGPDALDEAVHAFLLGDEARRVVQDGTRHLLVVAGGFLALSTLGGWFIEPVFRELYGSTGVSVPLLALAALRLLRICAFVAPVLLAGVVVLAVRPPAPRGIPGAATLRRAASLRLFAAAREAGLSAAAALRLFDPAGPAQLTDCVSLDLCRLELSYLSRATKLSGDAAAARGLGRELEKSGRHSFRRFGELVPTLGLLLLGCAIAVTAVAFYLPIFRMAEAIR